MQLVISGLLTDYQNRILLRQATEATLALVERAATPGTTPVETLDRAFREDTGLIVMPARLAGLYYNSREDRLMFLFRCIMRGGDIVIGEGGRPAGFFDSAPLPRGLSRARQRQIDGALYHAGGPPLLEREANGPGAWLGRLMRPDVAPPRGDEWTVAARIVESPAEARVEWLVAEPPPEGAPVAGEAPWETAARLLGRPSVRLARVEVAAGRPMMTLSFAATE